VLDLIQGTDEWRAARAGSLGASQVADVLAKTKNGWGASRKNIHAQLVTERLTGLPTDTFCSPAMQWGKDNEPRARAMYSFTTGNEVVEVGLVRHPTIKGTHASPDGLCGSDGLCEIKCPNSATHIETLTGTPIADRYLKQMQWQMRICDRAWCDFVSFDPRMPEEMQLHIERVHRDEAVISEMEAEVVKFLAEVDATVADLRERYLQREAA
jgi:Phage-related protein, predicted endonuclease